MRLDPATLVVHLHVVGLLMALLVVVNLFVPGRFHWREELSRGSLLNRQIFQAHSFFFVLLPAFFWVFSLPWGVALLDPTRWGRAVLGGLTVFWAVRMLVQWF